MGYRVELLGISDFLLVQYTNSNLAWQGLLRYWPRIILEEHTLDRKITKLVWYRRTAPTYGTVLQQSHNTVRYRTVRYRTGTVQYCTVSFVRPQRLRIKYIAANKKIAQVWVAGASLRLSNSLVVSRWERVLAFLFRSCFLRIRDKYLSIYWSTEASVAYAGTVNYLVKVQPWIFLLNLHFYISQVNVACGGGGSCEFVAAATTKFEIWRGPNVVLRFLRLYHWKPL